MTADRRVADSEMTLFKWLLLPASIIAGISVVVFVLADLHGMRTLRSAAIGALVLAGFLVLGAVTVALHQQRRR